MLWAHLQVTMYLTPSTKDQKEEMGGGEGINNSREVTYSHCIPFPEQKLSLGSQKE